jgi:tryptophan synthase alpha subunit
VIIGSRLVRAVSEAGDADRATAAVAEFIRGARTAMSR